MRDYDSYSKKLGRNTVGRGRLALAVAMLLAGVLGPGPAYGQRGAAGPVRGPDGSAIGEQWLFVIGIDEYGDDSGWQKLHCAVSDAKALRDALRSRYHIDQVFELYNREATWGRIDERLRWLAKHTQQDDGVLIYYAGHGHLDKLTKLGAWVPADGDRTPRSWMASTYIRRLLGSMTAKHVLLISDSCFAGDFFRTRGDHVETIDEPYYRRKYRLQSRQAITSGGLEPVMDSSLDGQSPFAYYLLRTLARNQKPYLVPRELFDGLKLGVARNSGQTPEVGFLKDARDEGGEFILFLKRGPRVPKPDDAAWQRRLAELKREAQERERREQAQKEYVAKAGRTFESLKQFDGSQAISAAKKADLWQAYLTDFEASGHEVAYAKTRLEHWRTHREPVAPPSVAVPSGKTWTNPTDGSEMIYVPAGTFKMGSDDGLDEEKPVHDVSVAAFYIGKCEVRNRQFSKFLQASLQWRKDRIDRKYHDGEYLAHWEGDTYPSDKADHPVTHVSWHAARAYCVWAGGQLPTEAQWEKASRGADSRLYPWGDFWNGQKCNCSEYWEGRGVKRDKVGPIGQTAVVGLFIAGASPCGALDMAGNVWEWTNSVLKPYPYGSHDAREDTKAGERRVARGGAYYCVEYNCRCAYRLAFLANGCHPSVGFRLAMVPAE